MPKVQRVTKWMVKHRLTVVAAGMCLVLACGYVFFLFKHGDSDVLALTQMTEQQDIPYCNTKSKYQMLDTYRPKKLADKTLPVVVYVHGGGWSSGNKHNALISYYAKYFAARGIATISIAYRLAGANPYPVQNNDVACALTYINNHSEELRIDPAKAIFFGDSAGGHLVAFAALNNPYGKYKYDAPRGVIDFYGVSDFSKIINGPHPDYNARRYLGPQYGKMAAKASPVKYVTKQSPRFLFVHGTDDKIVPIAQSREFYNALKAAKPGSKYLAIPGAHHGFIGPDLGSKKNQMIEDAIDAFLRETINVRPS